MRGVQAALEEFVAVLTAVGFRAGTDPEELSPDNGTCIWVQPRQIRDRTLGDDATLVAWCYLIGPNTDTATVMGLLDDTLEAFLEVADPADSDPVIDLASPIVMPTNPTTPLPAYRVAVDLDL